MKKAIIFFLTAITAMTVSAQRAERIACVQYDQSVSSVRPNGIRTTSSQETAPLKSLGSPEIVVCLAEFSDVKFTCASTSEDEETRLSATKEMFETFFNGNNTGAGKNTHSASDYFKEMSFGKFTPHFNIVTGVTVDNPRSYYANSKGLGFRATFRNDALAKLSPIIKDDVSTKYDWNKDGKVDGVIIVFPSYGQNVVQDGTSMHACCWPSNMTVGGVAYATALIAPELYNNKDNSINSIGVYVHEMSHMLGLPDFYDTTSPMKSPGMDYWSLMDYGEYLNNGYNPTPYTAYERMYMGWFEPEELSEATTITGMKSIGEGGTAYIIYNDRSHNEYYLLENLSEGYDWSNFMCRNFGSGLIIYHVDYDANAWASTTVNNDFNRQRMTIMPANGHFELIDNYNSYTDGGKMYLSELRGHLWPLKYETESVIKYYGLTTGNDSLTDTKRTEEIVSPAIDRIAPAATLNNANTDGKNLMHKPITEITYDKSTYTCSFKFMGGTPPTGIESVSGSSCDVPVNSRLYNLSGQAVSDNFKGIIIKSGKKILRY